MTKTLIWLLVINVVVFAEDKQQPVDTIKMQPPILDVNEEPIQKEASGRISSIEEKLPPLPPIFPSFLQPGGSLLNDQPLRRKGILTVLVIKSNKKPEDMTPEDESRLSMFKNQVSDSFSKLASLIMNDIFHANQQQTKPELIGGGSEDVDRKHDHEDKKQTVHLLGGKDDIDSKFYQMMSMKNDMMKMNKMMNQFNSNELDENDPYEEEQQEEEESNLNSSKYNSILSWFKINKAPESPMIMMNDQQQEKKKCMMQSFMRLKASIYYRTIVHLLFISGIMLIILFMAILTVRVYKRRQALKYYSKNMKISTIEAEQARSPRSLFLFRMGSVRNSYAQKPFSSVLATPPPPPYETSIKAKYETQSDSDEKKSLPDYEETLKKDQI